VFWPTTLGGWAAVAAAIGSVGALGMGIRNKRHLGDQDRALSEIHVKVEGVALEEHAELEEQQGQGS